MWYSLSLWSSNPDFKHKKQGQVIMKFMIYPAENLWWLYGIFILAAIAMIFGYFSLARQSQNPSGVKKYVLRIRYILIFFAVGMLVACWLVYKQETATLEITEKTLIVHAGWYSQEIARSSLQLEEAKIVNLEEVPSLQPVIRTNGTGMPTLQAGWFVLRNRKKAFLLITKPRKVLYLPTRDFILMVSLKNPEKLLENLSEL
jgi:hypothetical protein